jgi:hypothetical protein
MKFALCTLANALIGSTFSLFDAYHFAQRMAP